MTQPFSRVYCIPDAAQKDSERLRRRLGKYASGLKETYLVVERIEIETGVRVPLLGGYRSLDLFFQNAEMRDILDGITHIYAALSDQAQVRARSVDEAYHLRAAATGWRAFVSRVLAEEHSAYQVDEKCNVKYAIDEAYALNRKATLNGLQATKWDATRAEFERAFDALDDEKQDANGAVRAIAASVEACAKVILGSGVARVGPAEIEKNLWPIVQCVYSGDQVAANASHLILKSLGDWISATHQYRHGQSAVSEVVAPIETTIQLLTSGAGFIRWLIELENKRPG